MKKVYNLGILILVIFIFVSLFTSCRRPSEVTLVPPETGKEESPSPQPPKVEKEEETPPEGLIPKSMRKLALDFSLKDLSGETFILSELKGKVVLIDFTADWCDWCKKQIPDLRKVYETFRNEKVRTFGIDHIDGRYETLSSASRLQGELPYPLLLDKDGSVNASYFIEGIPHYVLVDKEGKIAFRYPGYHSTFETTFTSLISYLLKE